MKKLDKLKLDLYRNSELIEKIQQKLEIDNVEFKTQEEQP